MKKAVSTLVVAGLLLLLFACGAKDAWQEQYDLGMRYLNDGNYEEAIIAFTAAIEIDPKRPEAYLGAAEAYIAADDIDAAIAILEKGYKATGDQDIGSKLEEISGSPENDIHAFLTALLQEDGALTYADIPECFFMDYDDLSSFLGLPLYKQTEKVQTGSRGGGEKFSYSCRECYYGEDYGSIIDGWSTAPVDSKSIISVIKDVPIEFKETWGTPTGWLDICFGDDYATVLRKLRLSAEAANVLEAYKGIWIDIHEDGAKSGLAFEESGGTMNNQPLPQIYVKFYSTGADEPKYVWFEFFDGSHLGRVHYTDEALLNTMIATG